MELTSLIAKMVVHLTVRDPCLRYLCDYEMTIRVASRRLGVGQGLPASRLRAPALAASRLLAVRRPRSWPATDAAAAPTF